MHIKKYGDEKPFGQLDKEIKKTVKMMLSLEGFKYVQTVNEEFVANSYFIVAKKIAVAGKLYFIRMNVAFILIEPTIKPIQNEIDYLEFLQKIGYLVGFIYSFEGLEKFIEIIDKEVVDKETASILRLSN